jgi:membrane-associated phospholipid phosphatase
VTPSLLGEPSRYVRDFKGFMTAPAHWDKREWTALGTVLAATSLAYQYDYKVREHYVPQPRPRDYHDVEDAIPIALVFGATWFAAKRTGSDARFTEATTMVRAAALAGSSSLVFKLGLGRARPGPGVERDGWYDAGRSMPSGHTAIAIAVGTVLAESGTPKRRWVRRVAGYGLGAGMAYLRVKHDAHWFSDTVPGAALGIAAGRYALAHDTNGSPRASFFVAPLDGGAMLSYSIALAR